ncbi:MAG: hypothetical protein QOK43_1370 [Acidimicrobiaceae bacterium]|nr:hypothetical protein [Acidimicrobiaceae bacterium]
MLHTGPVPRFEPFAAVRYTTPDGRVDRLVAPPYDVISPEDRARLVALDEHNAVRIELPAEEGGRDRYEVAADLWRQWRADGVLADDDAASFYAYRMRFTDETGRARQTLGVLGALELSRPGEAGILPHERTTSKDKADRLNLLRACRANLSPIWGLSLAPGLSDLLPVDRAPDAQATDEHGVAHELWRITDQSVIDAVRAAVGAEPLVIADGHHRYETALAFRDEDGSPGAHAVLAYVVELSDEQLAVGPIHRLLNGPVDLSSWFDMEPVDEPAAGSMSLVTRDGLWRLTAKPATADAAEADLDSSRLDVALAALPNVSVRFQHGVDLVVAAVEKGDADAAVLLRPATVTQIAATGHGGERMPPKTTFFFPKPRTGMVFRALDG